MTARCRAELRVRRTLACSRVEWTLVAALWLASCASRESPSRRPVIAQEKPPAVASAKAPPERLWPPFRASEEWPLAAEGFISAGHEVGRCVADVRVSPAIAPQYQQWTAGAETSTGSVLIERCRDVGSGEITTAYGMEKRPNGEWSYVVTSQSGSIRYDGRLALCGRCHAEAVSDSIFGLPRILEAPQGDKAAPSPPTRAPAPSASPKPE